MPFGRTGDYTIYHENYNMSRDLKSFLFNATDKNLAYVSPRFLLGSQSFVMDAFERSKFIVNLEVLLKQNAIDETDFFYYIGKLSRHSLNQWMVEPTVQKDTVLSVVLYYKRNSYQCPGDIIRFCNNAFKHCNDHLRNTSILAGGSASMRSTRLKKQFAWLDLYDPAEDECYWICMILQRRNALLLVDFSRWLFSFIELVGGSTSMRLTRWKKQFAWLDLYDPAEEECYWMAVDRPVSPTLQ
ncbi:hypothetical protein V6N13_032957 [Hibiscus sabdariffa]